MRWIRTIRPGFTVCIPKAIRTKFALQVGDKFELISRDNSLFLMPITNRPRSYKKILELALDFFDDDESATLWLYRDQFGLGGKRPIDVMRTKKGAQEVIDLIMRIRHGILC